MKRFFAVLLLMISPVAAQAMETAGYHKITKIWSWGAETNATVIVVLETAHPTCPNGYWFEDSTGAGSKNLMSMALAAYYAKAPVKIFADEAVDFWGTAAKDCKIQLIAVGE